MPSLCDLFFFLTLFWLFILNSSWGNFLGDAVVGLQIRTGDFILAHGAVPTQDLYSFSKPHDAYYAYEWLSFVLYSGIHQVFGLRGIAAISAIVLCLYPVVQLRDCLQRGCNLLIALGLVFVGVRIGSIHFLARPHLFSMLLLAVCVWAIERDRKKPSHAIWLMIPIVVLWTNLHAGYFALLVYLGLLSAGCFVEALVQPDLASARKKSGFRYALLAVTCTLASLVNPYGVNQLIHLMRFGSAKWLTRMSQEFAPPTAIHDERVIWYYGMLALALAVAVSLLWRRQIVEPLWIAFFAFISFTSARYLPVFIIGVTPVIAEEMTRLWKSWVRNKPRNSTSAILEAFSIDLAPAFRRNSAWLLVMIVILMWPAGPIEIASRFPDFEFPTGLIERHRDLLSRSRLFTTDHWGDYLVYRSYPEQKVFVDGRTDFYGEQLGIEYLTILDGDPGWQELMDKWRFDAILCPPGKKIALAVGNSKNWKLLESSKDAVILVRTAPSGM